jgi:ribosomal-protein-alanine N-acetyltransferase
MPSVFLFLRIQDMKLLFLVDGNRINTNQITKLSNLIGEKLGSNYVWKLVQIFSLDSIKNIINKEATDAVENRIICIGSNRIFNIVCEEAVQRHDLCVGLFPDYNGIVLYDKEEYNRFSNIRNLAVGQIKIIDVLCVNQRIYPESIAVTVSQCQVNHSMNYDSLLFKELASESKKVNATIMNDNVRTNITDEFSCVLIQNGKYYSKSIKISDNADKCDGKLNIVFVRHLNLSSILNIRVKLSRGISLVSACGKSCVEYKADSAEINGIDDFYIIKEEKNETSRFISAKVIKEAIKIVIPLPEKEASIISLQRVYLRHLNLEDLDEFYEISHDEMVMPEAGLPADNDLENAKSNLTRRILNPFCFGIILRKTNKLIGTISIQDDLRRFGIKSKIIGYELNRNYWGNGYMTEALNGVLDYCFSELSLDIVGISHFKSNIRSKAVIDRCGFKYEGTIRLARKRFDNKIFDEVMYSMTKSEYFEIKSRSKIHTE